MSASPSEDNDTGGSSGNNRGEDTKPPAAPQAHQAWAGLQEDREQFTVIDAVEWGPRRGEDGYDTDQELVPRPKPKPTDRCHCVPPRDLPDNLGDVVDGGGGGDGAAAALCCCDLTCVNFACQEECRSNCPAGMYCGNRRIQRKQFAKVEVFDAGKKGRGLRVLEDVKKGQLILEYTGRAVKATKLTRLFSKYQYDRRLYIMALDKDVILDARSKGGVARFINHSCQPLCQVQRWKVKGLQRAAVVATQDVAAGTELTFDYQWQRQRGRAPTKCYCGAPNCRGTLEVPKSMELSGLERELEGHWVEVGDDTRLDHTIVNRTIRVLINDQYEMGEVTGYDSATGKHTVLYRHDMTEETEDLARDREKWMILSAQIDQSESMIGRKLKVHDSSKSGSVDSPTRNNSLLLQAAERLHGGRQLPGTYKHYLYVQTPVKEAMYAKHLVERCERNCGVVITAEQFAQPPLPPATEEDAEKYAALDQSLDGTVWKLSITGSDVAKAREILEKNKAYVEKALLYGGGGNGGFDDSASVMTAFTASTNQSSVFTGSTAVSSSMATTASPNNEVFEIVFPRSVVDAVKRDLPSLRNKCRSTTLAFAASESKSKQFAKLLIEGSLPSDVAVAQDVAWKALQGMAEGLPNAHPHTTLPRHLGLLGGTLSALQFRLLCQSNNDSSSKDGSNNLSMDANQDLRRIPFFASFETTYKCTVWVQSDEDKGRITSDHRIVDEATPDGPRKVYLGCPNGLQDVSRLFGLLESRAKELERGVQYLHLGSKDRVYQPLMMSRHFFSFVEKVTGASVQIDGMMGDFLRMDGRGGGQLLQQQRLFDLTNNNATAVPPTTSEGDRASLAEELVRLQIELYRDHCIREQGWIFGRDWTILQSLSPSSPAGMAAAAVSAVDPNDTSKSLTISSSLSSSSSSFGQLDAKTAAQGALEIPEVVAAVGHDGNAAAHAAIILYRFVSVVESTQSKVREAVLACVFLANKCQKVNKWKRLEAVLEAAYEAFYPGTKFDKGKEDVLVLEERVIAAEKEILQTLEYDIFWPDVEWIVTAATGAGRMKADFVERVMDFAFSGPVLSAGAELWLKYGVEYVFAVSAAFLGANLDHLLPALSVIPLKVLAAAELLVKSARLGRPAGKKAKSHPLLEGGRDRLEKCIPRIREACVATMNKVTKNGSSQALAGASIVDQRYKLISEQGRRRYLIRGVPKQFAKDHIVAVADAVAAESACNVYIGTSSEAAGREDVIFDGSWRAVAVAEHLLRTRAVGPMELPRAVDASSTLGSGTKIQAKVEPGCVQASDIQTSEGWEGTIQSQMTNQMVKDRRIGGKSCIAGKVSESALRRSGLRWWIPLKNGSSPSGSINDMFLVRENESDIFKVLGDLATAVAGTSAAFPKLASLANNATNGSAERFTAVSLQQWPSEKVANKELEKAKAKGETMQLGFSAAALQEMQLLTQLHSLISLPFGHPNFVLPVGIAVAVEGDQKETTSPVEEEKKDSNLIAMGDPMFSLFRSNEENEKVAEKDKQVKCRPHLLLHPTPFIMNRFMSKKQLNGIELRSNKALMTAWFHDLLSALVHCHSNHVVMRTIQSDQIVVDHNGTAKFGGLYRCTVLSQEVRDNSSELWKASRSSKKKDKHKDDDEDFSNNPFVAPETLLGSPKHTKEGDVWAIGSLLANLLLGKPLFVGKDRSTLLTAQFKIVGTPARENFEEAAKFPHYAKPAKKYPRGVEKALGHMLKDESAQHHKAIDLIARMLQLDPRKRCTAAEALSHDFMIEYMESCSFAAFRDEYVSQWMRLKEVALTSSGSRRDSSNKAKQMSTKRKAMLLAASRDSDEDVDDLYDLDDIMDQPTKKVKD